MIPRSFNAKGPRCLRGNPGYLPWPPQLISGYNVTRWESTHGDTPENSDLEILEFRGVKLTPAIYGCTFDAMEMNIGNSKYGEIFKIRLGRHGDYSPSALQKYSRWGYMRLTPWYVAQWHLLKVIQDGEDYFAFHREGYRPDHVDRYYNWGPMLGLKMD